MSGVTDRMKDAFRVVEQFRPTVTSVSHGGHVKDSAHYAHRAIDVGAFGGTSVGFNVPTWQALMTAIASRRFEKIGTFGQLANNPTAQAFAQQNGVELFTDEGSGAHLHLQVGA